MTAANFLIEDILDALMLEEHEPSYTALTRWSERYPEHREALAEFFATWAVQAELPQETVVDEERLANLAVSRALDIVHRRDEEAKRTSKVTARPRLIAAAHAASISEEQLAALAGLDSTIVEKLDLRRIDRVPQLCLEWLATALSTSADQIQEMATGPPLVAAGTRYKAKGKPTPATEDFAVAIRNSSLSDEAKHFWLEVVAAERKSGKE